MGLPKNERRCVRWADYEMRRRRRYHSDHFKSVHWHLTGSLGGGTLRLLTAAPTRPTCLCWPGGSRQVSLIGDSG